MDTSVPSILYKYIPATRISFFTNATLCFSPPEGFNDIFDCQFICKGIFSDKFINTEMQNYIEDIDALIEQAVDNELQKFPLSMQLQIRQRLSSELKREIINNNIPHFFTKFLQTT